MKKQSKRKVAPKKLQAIQASRHLRVVHRRHTGRILPRQTTSYPTLAMILLCLGVFLVNWTSLVKAAFPGSISNDYVVHASVPGPAPSQPATIDLPVNGTTFTSTPITVSGSCPLSTYETLYRNGFFSGVVLCNATGRYELSTDLFSGTNQLQVRDFSQTDLPGPLSNTVTVVYDRYTRPGVTNSGSSSGTATNSNNNPTINHPTSPIAAAEPLIFKSMFAYSGHYVGDPTTWQLDIEGGTAPYAISVDWGDGNHDLISRPRPGSFSLDHVYKRAGGYKGSYVTKFSASDTNGEKTFLQLLAIVNNPVGAVSHNTGGAGSTNSTPGYLAKIMKYIWPSYGLVLLMLASFWLGERREFQHLKPRYKKARHA